MLFCVQFVSLDKVNLVMRVFYLVYFLLFAGNVSAQGEVRWNFVYNISTQSIEVVAHIAEGWHIYSQTEDAPFGPVPTTIVFEKNKSVKLIGEVQEPVPETEYDPNFEAELSYFENEVKFTQKIKKIRDTSIQGTVTYMICNDEMCLPPVDKEFIIEIKE